MVERSLDTMALQAFIDPTEWLIFRERVQDIADSFPDIIGVLAVGSLVQSFRPPVDFYENLRPGSLGNAYESIRNPQRRKIFPDDGTDLDIWVCTKDTKTSGQSEEKVNGSGVALLEELVRGTTSRPSQQWYRKKQSAFENFYKHPDMYTEGFKSLNDPDAPWMASRFTSVLEQDILKRLPDFAARIGRFTMKKIPGNFLEVRAYPESMFHLRPDENFLEEDDFEDREPFPRIADAQWIGPNHVSVILHNTDDVSIYPFKEFGRVLGQSMHERLVQEVEAIPRRSLGAMLIKPDALARKQVKYIKQKLVEGVRLYGGRIIREIPFKSGLTEQQVEQVYPLLTGRDLVDASRYLQEGTCLVVVVEANLSQPEMLSLLGEIKGPRIADRSDLRLLEGRIENGSIRDLLPLPGDEEKYRGLLPSIFNRKRDPDHRFSVEEYAYYYRNLVHAPDNMAELEGLLDLAGYKLEN